jgi:V/A-type H+-transporting ATPase subunit E
MSLAQITEKIERDARAEADKVIVAAREREDEVRREAETEIKKIVEAANTRFEKERPEIFKRREIVARLDVSKLQLGVRRRLIQDVFDSGLEQLKKLNKDEYLAFCGRLLKEASEGGDEVLDLSQNEKYLGPEWVEEFNAKNGAKVTISPNRQDFSGGFILNRGRVSVNCSWEMLMRVAQEKLEAEVVKRLFPA